MRKTLACEASVSCDGHLVIAESVGAKLAAHNSAKLRLPIGLEDPSEDFQDGWQILREMPKTGGEGTSDRTAEEHDRVVYTR